MSENWDRYCLPVDANLDVIINNFESLKLSFGASGNDFNGTLAQGLIDRCKALESKPVETKKRFLGFTKKEVEYTLPPRPASSLMNDWSFVFHYRIESSLDLYYNQVCSKNPNDSMIYNRVQGFKDHFNNYFTIYRNNLMDCSDSIVKGIMMWRREKRSKCHPNTPTNPEKLKPLIELIETTESCSDSEIIDTSFQNRYISLVNSIANTYGSATPTLSNNLEIQQLLQSHFDYLMHISNQPINPDIWYNQRVEDFSHQAIQGLAEHSLSKFTYVYHNIMCYMYDSDQSLLANNGCDYTMTLEMSDINNICEMLLVALQQKYSFIPSEETDVWPLIEGIIRDNLYVQAYPSIYNVFSLLYLEDDKKFDAYLHDLSEQSPRQFSIPADLFKDFSAESLPLEDAEGYSDIDKEWIYLESIFQDPISMLKEVSNEIRPFSKIYKLLEVFLKIQDIGSKYTANNEQLTRSELIVLIRLVIICANFTSNVYNFQFLTYFFTPNIRNSSVEEALNLYQEVIEVAQLNQHPQQQKKH